MKSLKVVNLLKLKHSCLFHYTTYLLPVEERKGGLFTYDNFHYKLNWRMTFEHILLVDYFNGHFYKNEVEYFLTTKGSWSCSGSPPLMPHLTTARARSPLGSLMTLIVLLQVLWFLTFFVTERSRITSDSESLREVNLVSKHQSRLL